MPKLHALVPLALVLAIQPARAEFARIRDPDASANLRNEPRNTAPIAAKIPNGAYVYTPEPNSGGYRQNGWQFVVYRQNGRLLEGWMHGSRLQPLSRYAAVPVKAAADGFSCISGGSGIRVRVGRFDFAREKPHFNSTQNGRITRYRDREIYGTDGTVPRRQSQARPRRTIRRPVQPLYRQPARNRRPQPLLPRPRWRILARLRYQRRRGIHRSAVRIQTRQPAQRGGVCASRGVGRRNVYQNTLRQHHDLPVAASRRARPGAGIKREGYLKGQCVNHPISGYLKPTTANLSGSLFHPSTRKPK